MMMTTTTTTTTMIIEIVIIMMNYDNKVFTTQELPSQNFISTVEHA